jgi:hypothetical protein
MKESSLPANELDPYYEGPTRYLGVGPDPSILWFVPVYHHGKKIGNVYVDVNNGKVWGASFKKKIKKVNKVNSGVKEDLKDINTKEGNNSTNVSVPVAPMPVNKDNNETGGLPKPVKKFALPLTVLGLLTGSICWYFKR